MKLRSFVALIAVLALPTYASSAVRADFPKSFTRLKLVTSPRIFASAEAFPGGKHSASNLVDANNATEYASNSKGTNTFVEFDFGTTRSIAAFWYLDRNDPALVSASKLIFEDEEGKPSAVFAVVHAAQRSGLTVFTLPRPVQARRARWQVTGLASDYQTVGGAEIAFYETGQVETNPRAVTLDIRPGQLQERGKPTRRVEVSVNSPYLESFDAQLEGGVQPQALRVSLGNQSVWVEAPLAGRETELKLSLTANGQPLARQEIILEPVRVTAIYLLPHSHVDIGYTALQSDVVRKQNSNLEAGMRLARETADYPEGARFKWNAEVLWPVDNYLRLASPEQRATFIQAVRAGQIGLDGFYGNILTGLCRPEELVRLLNFGTRVSDLCGVPIDSAMISDVPGYTWSTVTAMAQAGIRYLSFAPNYFDRIGSTMQEWQNRPFWWMGADGQSKVLCWCPSRGYALGHLIGDGEALARFVPGYLRELEETDYPYEITYLRWNVHGDNGSPDEKIADVVRAWNERYLYPRLILSTTSEAFREFERRYGDRLPVYRGDYTPYWEDGAGSSAAETAMNRATAERLVQAETLWALCRPDAFPAGQFQAAWRDVLLYSEHTWGAHNSISQPDLPFVRDQWRIKREFAREASQQSLALLRAALEGAGEPASPEAIDVFNTQARPRTGLVTLPPELSRTGDRVTDDQGVAAPSQRLSTGELAFLAREVAPLSSRRYIVTSGVGPQTSGLRSGDSTLESPDYKLRIDERTGAIASLVSRRLNRELVDQKPGAPGLNDYLYLPGSDLQELRRSGAPKIRIQESGPLVASLRVESEAPGCRSLTREIRLINGLDHVELIDVIDKLPIRAKEGVHIGFSFEVPGPTVRLDVGWAAVRPELDQIPGSCKNWFSAQRWVDVSNDKFGVTWVSLDAPLVEIGGITANLIGARIDPQKWVQHLEPSSTIYSWVMNNHWHTNYRAEQDGPTTFRFALRAHQRFEPETAATFGADLSQPLIAARARNRVIHAPRLRLPPGIALSAFKPADEGSGWIIRLFGSSDKAHTVNLVWQDEAPKYVWLSDVSEKRRRAAGPQIEIPAWGLVTLRCETD